MEQLAQPRSRRKRFAAMVAELTKTLALAAILFLLVRALVLPFEVEGSSMIPSLQEHDRVLVNQTVYYHFDLNRILNLLPGEDRDETRVIFPFHGPERGDVVVLDPPVTSDKPYIKRVIGLPGESIAFRGGDVVIDGVRLEEPYLDRAARTECHRTSYCRVDRIPDGYVYVLGDNRIDSTDSRDFGLVRIEDIIGEAWFTNWPIRDFGLLSR
jgi:signal peptidase I